jgi:hypothetical protein
MEVVCERPLEYLYAAKIDELASQLRREGYEVTARPTGEDQGYDLVARKDNRKMAIEVKTIGDLKGSFTETRNLRKRAHEQGFDDFRLIIVSPPGK